jgi:hypothetical protein
VPPLRGGPGGNGTDFRGNGSRWEGHCRIRRRRCARHRGFCGAGRRICAYPARRSRRCGSFLVRRGSAAVGPRSAQRSGRCIPARRYSRCRSGGSRRFVRRFRRINVPGGGRRNIGVLVPRPEATRGKRHRRQGDGRKRNVVVAYHGRWRRSASLPATIRQGRSPPDWRKINFRLIGALSTGDCDRRHTVGPEGAIPVEPSHQRRQPVRLCAVVDESTCASLRNQSRSAKRGEMLRHRRLRNREPGREVRNA